MTVTGVSRPMVQGSKTNLIDMLAPCPGLTTTARLSLPGSAITTGAAAARPSERRGVTS